MLSPVSPALRIVVERRALARIYTNWPALPCGHGKSATIIDRFDNDLEAAKKMRPEGLNHGNIHRIAAAVEGNPSDLLDVVTGVEHVPAVADRGLEPGVEVHRRRVGGDSDIADIPIAIAGWDIKAPVERDGEGGEIPAHAQALVEGLEGRARLACKRVTEGQM